MEAAPRFSNQGLQLVGVLLKNICYVELGEVAVPTISYGLFPGFGVVQGWMCRHFHVGGGNDSAPASRTGPRLISLMAVPTLDW
jgi:hypothetical protein